MTDTRNLYCPSCFSAIIKPTRERGKCDYCGFPGEFPHWTADQREVKRLGFALQTAPTVVVSLLAANARGSGERQRALQDAFDAVRQHVAQYIPEQGPSQDCDVIVERHDTPRPLPIIDPISGVIWSDERIRVWHIFDIGHTPEKGKHLVRVDIFAAPATRPTADLGDDGDALREGIAAWDAFVAARQRMNDARPDVVNATAAERALYGERYQADNEAERTFRAAACRFFQDGHASAVLSRSGG